MFILKVKPEDFPLITKFITPYEPTCVQLAHFVRKQFPELQIICTNPVLQNYEQIKGVFYLNSTLFHCLPFLTDEVQALLTQYLQDKTIKCIQGDSDSSEFLLNILIRLSYKPMQKNLYTLMTLKDKLLPPPEPLCNDDMILRCTINNLDALYSLQYEYLKSEVVPHHKTLTDSDCRLSLKQILTNQLVIALFSDDKLVAKANTNAIGINCIQLGGVYTNPLYRRNYYAWHLVYEISRKILKNKKTAVLFVKTKNTAASALYRKAGFSESGLFEIIYF